MIGYQERARWLVTELQAVGYYLDLVSAVAVAAWWDLRDGTLLLQGKPGCGKTSLIQSLASIFRVPEPSFYEVTCYRSIGAREVLYVYDASARAVEPRKVALALADPHPNTILFFDDIDKIPRDEAFQAVINKVLEEGVLAVTETAERIKRVHGCAPLHTCITSNAEVDGASLIDMLSFDLQRRCYLVELPVPDEATLIKMLSALFPCLTVEVVTDAVRFWELANAGDRLNKGIATSELKQWVRMLDYMRVTRLTEDAVKHSLSRLAKNRDDHANLTKKLTSIFRQLEHPERRL